MPENIKKIEIPARNLYECETCHTQYRIEKDALRCASMEIDPIQPGFAFGVNNDHFYKAGIVTFVSEEIYNARRGDLHTKIVNAEEYLLYPESIESKNSDSLFSPGGGTRCNSETFRFHFERGKYHILTEEEREFFLTFIRLEEERDNSYFRILAESISDDKFKTIEELLHFNLPNLGAK